MAVMTNPPRPASADPADPAPWSACFEIREEPKEGEEGEGKLVTDGALTVRQVGTKLFRLGCKVTYTGTETGLEKHRNALRDPADDLDEVLRRMRTVTDRDLGRTDLTSVPRPLLWLVPRYGVHTPAALIHDRMIGKGPDGSRCPLHDWAADRFFRFMLKALGVSPLKRYTMWTATVLRTRLKNGLRQKVLLALWGLACAGGIALLIWGLLAGSTAAVVASLVLPFVAALLFGKQYGAGICWAVAAPVVIPPTLVVVLALGIWWIEDHIGSFLRRRHR